MGDECWLCVDCVGWHANGDVSAVSADRAGAVMACPNGFVVDCGEDGEWCDAFSSWPCDACGSWLAGERHRAFMVREVV